MADESATPSIDRLIEKLGGELKPVAPLAKPLKWAFVFAAATASLVVAGILILFPRGDLGQRMLEFRFTGDLLFPLALLFTSLIGANEMGRPGFREARSRKKLFWLAAFAIVVFSAIRISLMSHDDAMAGLAPEKNGLRHFVVVSILSLVSGAILFAGARKSAPMRPMLTGAMIGLAAFSAGAFGVRFNCFSFNGVHIAVFHWLLPCLACVLAGALLGRKLLRW